MPVVAAVLIEPEGEPKKILRVTLPLGMQLIHGTRVIIDQNQPMTAPYVICFTNGCMADYEATADMIGKMKKGQGLVVQAINSTGQPISLVLPLADFAKAYDGPPTDPKVFEEQQKKLQEELQRRADEARKKLEQQQGAPGASAAPPAPPGKDVMQPYRRTRCSAENAAPRPGYGAFSAALPRAGDSRPCRP